MNSDRQDRSRQQFNTMMPKWETGTKPPWFVPVTLLTDLNRSGINFASLFPCYSFHRSENALMENAHSWSIKYSRLTAEIIGVCHHSRLLGI
jgi:hypothetical protein